MTLEIQSKRKKNYLVEKIYCTTVESADKRIIILNTLFLTLLSRLHIQLFFIGKSSSVYLGGYDVEDVQQTTKSHVMFQNVSKVGWISLLSGSHVLHLLQPNIAR